MEEGVQKAQATATVFAQTTNSLIRINTKNFRLRQEETKDPKG